MARAMNLRLTGFGERISAPTGIWQLMEDLGGAVADPSRVVAMLGGGNPAHIPEIDALWRRQIAELLAEPGAVEGMLGDYDPPRGCPGFLSDVAEAFNREFGWRITPEHVAVTTGSQTSSFMLFRMLAGEGRKILFPAVPEYIGYAGAASDPGMLVGWRPEIERIGERAFKYRIAFRALREEVAAICLSRPTNPSANVVEDAELAKLSEMAAANGSFLILDNAYGHPFPGVVFEKIGMPFADHIIHLFSLSKIGLPGTRTGIVVACPELIRRLAAFNANLVLATCSVGQQIARGPIASGELARVSREVALPFYREQCRRALAVLHEELPPGIPWRVHRPGGAFFLWLWVPGLAGGCRTLYERLKAEGVLVVPGDYFFAGLSAPWDHATECVRLSYCAGEEAFRRGARVIARHLRGMASHGHPER